MYRIICGRRLAALAAGCLALFALINGSLGAEKLLRWKFVKGDQRHLEMDQNVTIAVTKDGRTGQMKLVQTIVVGQTIDDVNEQGVASITQKFEHIKISMEGAPQVSFSYDSQSTDPPKGEASRVAPIFEAVIKAQFTTKVSPQGEILEVIVPDDLVKFVEEAKEFPLLSEVYSQQGLTRLMQQSAGGAFPQQPVEKGDQWTNKEEVKDPQIGTQIVTTKYSYDGEEEFEGRQLDKLVTSVTIEFVPGEDGQAPVMITDQNATGSLLFDSESGHLVNGDSSQHIKMETTSQGKKIEQEITMKTVVKVTSGAS